MRFLGRENGMNSYALKPNVGFGVEGIRKGLRGTLFRDP